MGDQNTDKISIAVFGSTGSGKSTFINLLSPESNLPVSDLLESCTRDTQTGRDFTFNERTVTLIDTPGFDDTEREDADILQSISGYLENQYRKNLKLSGVIYLHRISDQKMGGVSRRSFRMMSELCGERNYKNVMIVTNMWDKVPPAEGEKREAQLRTDTRYFKPALDKQAKLARHDNTLVSAKNILKSLLDNTPIALSIQNELVEDEKHISDTTAGKTVIQNLIDLYKQLTSRIDNFDPNADATEKAELQKLTLQKKRTHEQVNKLRPKCYDAWDAWSGKNREEKVAIMFRLASGVPLGDHFLESALRDDTTQVSKALDKIFSKEKHPIPSTLQTTLRRDTKIDTDSDSYYDLRTWCNTHPKTIKELEQHMKGAFPRVPKQGWLRNLLR